MSCIARNQRLTTDAFEVVFPVFDERDNINWQVIFRGGTKLKRNFGIEFTEPSTRQELLDALHSIHIQATRFWEELPIEYFFKPYGENWSPAENVVHLNKSTRPVALAMRLPSIVHRLLFGVRTDASRSYQQIKLGYQEALNKGGQAGGYAPKRQSLPDNPQRVREKIMHDWNRIWKQLNRAVAGWNDHSLDQLRLPHPLLGKLSMREMLYFTLYHHQHHLQIVAARANSLIKENTIVSSVKRETGKENCK